MTVIAAQINWTDLLGNPIGIPPTPADRIVRCHCDDCNIDFDLLAAQHHIDHRCTITTKRHHQEQRG